MNTEQTNENIFTYKAVNITMELYHVRIIVP